jgi:hypothetical protein
MSAITPFKYLFLSSESGFALIHLLYLSPTKTKAKIPQAKLAGDSSVI